MITLNEPQDRPLVTFALFAYNQEQYIREAIEGAFSQVYEPLEIILSDDCSADLTFEIMKEMAAAYDGPHMVKVRQNAVNQGLTRHVNQIVASASGKYLVAAAGDDISLATRTAITVAILEEDQSNTFCETAFTTIDEAGSEILQKKLIFPVYATLMLADLLRGRITGLTGAARTYRLSAIKFFPPLDPECPTEDSPSVLRCLLQGPAIYLPDRSVKRRTHGTNLSGPDSLRLINLDAILAQYIRDIEFARSKALISDKVCRQANSWARRNMFKRIAMQRQRNGNLFFRLELKKMAQQGASYRDRIFFVSYLSKITMTKKVS